jgi:hypothetical protein
MQNPKIKNVFNMGITVIHAFVLSPFTCKWKIKLVKILCSYSMNFQTPLQWTMDYSAENGSHPNFMCHFALTHPLPSSKVQSIVYRSQCSICPGISVISLWFRWKFRHLLQAWIKGTVVASPSTGESAPVLYLCEIIRYVSQERMRVWDRH